MSNALLGDATAPLAVRMRPRSLDEVVGQTPLLTPGSPLRQLAEGTQGGVSVILWGPAGTGKTSLAYAVAAASQRRFIEMSAITAGVKDVREAMNAARDARDLYGQSTLLFLDEIHRFSKAQQDALLPGVENGLVTLIAATTENPSFSVVSPLLSRSLLLRVEPLDDESVIALIERAVAEERGLAGNFTLEDAARAALVRLANGDARRALTGLDAAASIALQTKGAESRPIVIDVEAVETAVSQALQRYDRDGDAHYDIISAFIKSIRGSDPDAALHYLARMIEGGEDPRFIARRLIISAAEDVGLADPQALSLAVAAAEAVALIGMPEGRIPLAEAAVYLATAPKSNAAYVGINAALEDVRRGASGQVPAHLRDASYASAKHMGHGAGYLYPHDNPQGIVAQKYLPEPLEGTVYYRPTDRGLERDIGARLERLRRALRGE